MADIDRCLEILPQEDRTKAREWLQAVLDITEDDDSHSRQAYLQDFFNNWTYIARHCRPGTAGALFETVSPGILANELIWAAIFLESGADAQEVREMADNGFFECGPQIDDPEQPGQLGVITVKDALTETHFLTDRYQLEHPFRHLNAARKLMLEQDITFTEALQAMCRYNSDRSLYVQQISDRHLAALELSKNTSTAVGGRVLRDVVGQSEHVFRNRHLERLKPHGYQGEISYPTMEPY